MTIIDKNLDTARATVITMDSSSNNLTVDPTNLRIEAAYQLLNNQDVRNQSVLDGYSNERLIKTAAIDFDSNIRLLADMTWPDELYAHKIFDSVNSSGDLDVAKAIEYSVNLLKTPNIPYDNIDKNSLCLLSTMNINNDITAINTAIDNAKENGVKIHVGHLITSNPHTDNIARRILETIGSSYAVIEDMNAANDWVELIGYLEQFDNRYLPEISLPMDICFYKFDGFEVWSPKYLITPKESGELTVTLAIKDMFVPDMKVDESGVQTSLGNGRYEIKFNAQAGRTYVIEINKPLYKKGLYSIMAKMNKEPSHGGGQVCEGTLITTGAALKNGNVYVWGFRGSAQQGNGIRVVKSSSVPQKVDSLSNVTQLTAGAYHLLALDSNGDVWGWGQNIYGEAGGQGTYVTIPQKLWRMAYKLRLANTVLLRLIVQARFGLGGIIYTAS